MNKGLRPNLFVAGVTKGGTTSVFRMLETHSEVFGADVKEPETLLSEPATDALKSYCALYASSDAQCWRIDSSASYIYGGSEVAERIDRLCPDSKVVIVLRNPADRFVSFFNFLKHMQVIDRDETAEQYFQRCQSTADDPMKPSDYSITSADYWKAGLRAGVYADYLQDWFDVFGSRLKVMFFDDLKARPQDFTTDICSFIGIDPKELQDGLRKENKTLHHDNVVLHRIALNIYRRFGGLINRNRVVKRALLSVYTRVNTSSGSGRDGKDMLRELEAYYTEPNKLLMQMLKNQGLQKLPKWIIGEG